MNDAEKLIYKSNEFLRKAHYLEVTVLKDICTADGTALKLELEYKLSHAENSHGSSGAKNEFTCYSAEKLIGYLGICHFGGEALEVNGMVHPDFRHQGVFTKLFSLASGEWQKRSAPKMLLLSDRNSLSGQGFISGIGARFEHAEYEMYLRKDAKHTLPQHVSLRKAHNDDAAEIDKQNAVYFGTQLHDTPPILPEEEEKRGTIIFLAEAEENVVGKVHLEVREGVGGIYGLGILPEYRGKGYGRELLQAAIAELLKMGAQQVMLQVAVSNDKALNLYRSCGFEATSVMDYYELSK